MREAKDSVSCIPVIAFAKVEVSMAEQAGCPGMFEVHGTPEGILSRVSGSPVIQQLAAVLPATRMFYFSQRNMFLILRGASVNVDYRYAVNVCLDLLFRNGRIED